MEDDSPGSQPGTITAIQSVGKGRKRLVELSDGRHLVVAADAVDEAGVRLGSKATPELLAALERADHRIAAHEAALRLLSTRARSVSELRTRLAMRGFDPDTVEAEIERLTQSGLLNDAEFAEAWVARRQLSAPRGKRMLRYELLGRGIDPEEARRVTEHLDDFESALDVARRKTRSWKPMEFAEFAAKLSSFLQRRGFSLDVTTSTVETVWKEHTAGDSGED